jgi:hypothetical protein
MTEKHDHNPACRALQAEYKRWHAAAQTKTGADQRDAKRQLDTYEKALRSLGCAPD